MTEWISIKDKLPELKISDKGLAEWPSNDVLMYDYDRNKQYVGYYTVYGNWYETGTGCGCCCEPLNITHWMPLPEPPNEIKHTYSEIGTATGFRWLKADGSIGKLEAGETMPMPLPEPPK